MLEGILRLFFPMWLVHSPATTLGLKDLIVKEDWLINSSMSQAIKYLLHVKVAVAWNELWWRAWVLPEKAGGKLFMKKVTKTLKTSWAWKHLKQGHWQEVMDLSERLWWERFSIEHLLHGGEDDFLEDINTGPEGSPKTNIMQPCDIIWYKWRTQNNQVHHRNRFGSVISSRRRWCSWPNIVSKKALQDVWNLLKRAHYITYSCNWKSYIKNT